MGMFQKHYTREEARSLLPQIRAWLDGLALLRRRFELLDKELSSLRESGIELGGPKVVQWVKILAEMKQVLNEFHQREIQVKDLDRGLVDFPAIIGGKEVLLCWEKDEDDVEFWHDIDSGYAGREPIQ